MWIPLLAAFFSLAQDSTQTLAEAIRSNNEAKHLHQAARFAEADQAYDSALQLLSQVPDSDPLIRARFLSNYSLLRKDRGDLAPALRFAEDALTIRRRHLVAPDPEIAASLNNLGHVHFALGDYPKAGQLYEQGLAMRRAVLESNDPRLAESLANVALMQKLQGDLGKSIQSFEQALKMLLPGLPATHFHVSSVHHNLGANYLALGDRKAAHSHFLKALALAETHLSPGHHLMAPVLISLSSLELANGHLKAAHEWLHRARAIQVKYYPAGDMNHADADRLEIVLLTRQNRWDEAEPLLHKVREQITSRLSADHLELSDVYALLGELSQRRKDYPAAKEYFARAIRITETAFGPRSPSLASLLPRYARLLRREDLYYEAAKVEQQLQTIEIRSAIARNSLDAAKRLR